jgi:hypothetical protein
MVFLCRVHTSLQTPQSSWQDPQHRTPLLMHRIPSVHAISGLQSSMAVEDVAKAVVAERRVQMVLEYQRSTTPPPPQMADCMDPWRTSLCSAILTSVVYYVEAGSLSMHQSDLVSLSTKHNHGAAEARSFEGETPCAGLSSAIAPAEMWQGRLRQRPTSKQVCVACVVLFRTR